MEKLPISQTYNLESEQAQEILQSKFSLLKRKAIRYQKITRNNSCTISPTSALLSTLLPNSVSNLIIFFTLKS